MVRGILPRRSKKSFVGSSLRSPNSWGRPVASLYPPRSLYCSSLCRNKFGFTSVYEPVWTSCLVRTFCFSKFYCVDLFVSFALRQLWVLKVITPRMSRKFLGFVISWNNIKYSTTICRERQRGREREGERERERELTELSSVQTVATLLANNSQHMLGVARSSDLNLGRDLYNYLLSFPRFWILSIERFCFLFWSILNGVITGNQQYTIFILSLYNVLRGLSRPLFLFSSATWSRWSSQS